MISDTDNTNAALSLYWNPVSGRCLRTANVDVPCDEDGGRCLRLTPARLLVAGPFGGMIFVMFLPLFGIGVFLVSVLVPLMGFLAAATMASVRVAGRSMFFRWSPSHAGLAGIRRKRVSTGGGRHRSSRSSD